jgi:hypothetical protein
MEMQAFKFEDNKGVTRSHKWKEKQQKNKKKIIENTLYRK